MKVLITGAQGFIGKNLLQHLVERKDIEVVEFTREHSPGQLPAMLQGVSCVFHLAGINRPQETAEFQTVNAGLTQVLADAIKQTGQRMSVLYSSSTQALLDNPYGVSKNTAEKVLLDLAGGTQVTVHLFRLPNVFGKWARPNYNSAVATFCHNIAAGLPINVHDRAAPVTLVYIDDVVTHFIRVMDGELAGSPYVDVNPQYATTVGELSDLIHAFRGGRDTLITENVGAGLVRALYATYVSYLKPEQFTYQVPKYEDPRGCFVEMLKTPEAGQFSYFTAHPGVTRGGHYHHTKTEKFLVIKGQANFRFRHIQTGEFYEKKTNGEQPEIVETVPGWTHDITNIGTDEMLVMLWANEIFDREHPDTYAMPLTN
ncbi:NAD-dependent epimerase/dehydratase family protein [Castellaniella hirudinis]|uniref:NAD-dependent epimerase/dehydratase family protein n=1 Tax=Castellaniella hirudinis TaxID=1144617 RepID=A0ABV8RVJ7_9BURK